MRIAWFGAFVVAVVLELVGSQNFVSALLWFLKPIGLMLLAPDLPDNVLRALLAVRDLLA